MIRPLAVLLMATGLLLLWLGSAESPSAPPHRGPGAALLTGEEGAPASPAVGGDDRLQRSPAAVSAAGADDPAAAGHGPRVMVAIRVVDAAGAPLPGARLVWSDQRGQAAASRQRAERGKDYREALSLPERLAAIGEVGIADAEGRFVVEAMGPMLVVHGTAGPLGGLLRVDLAAPVPAEARLVLEPGDTLVVEVVDPTGQPIADVPVAVWFCTSGPGGGGCANHLWTLLGSTSPAGRVAFPGWRGEMETARARPEGRQLTAWAGLPLAGMRAEWLRPVVQGGTEPLRLVVPRTERRVAAACTASGRPFAWDGLTIELDWPGWPGMVMPLLAPAGRAELQCLAGELWSYRVRRGREPIGTGTVATAPEATLALVCADIIDIVGRTGSLPTPGSLAAQFRSALRGEVRQALAADAEGVFALAVHRTELAALQQRERRQRLQFRSGQSTCSVTPPVGDKVVDLGVLPWVAPEFATLEVTDDLGAPLDDLQLWCAAPDGARVEAVVLATGGGVQRISTAAGLGHLRVTLAAADCAGTVLELARGERRTIVLSRLGRRTAVLQLLADVEPTAMWLRLQSRWDPAGARWDGLQLWQRAQLLDGVPSFVVDFLPRARCRYELHTLLPPGVVASGELDFAGSEPPRLDGTRARRVDLDLSIAGGGDSCWLIVPGNSDASRPHCATRITAGRHRLTLGDGIDLLWFVGAGLLPAAVAVRAPGLQVALTAVGSTLPGVGVALHRVRPTAAMPATADVEVYAAIGARIDIDHRRLGEWSAAIGQPLWPCSYEWDEGGGGAATFGGGAWTLQPRADPPVRR